MARHDPSALDEFLNGIETVDEIFRVLHRRLHIVAHFAEGFVQISCRLDAARRN